MCFASSHTTSLTILPAWDTQDFIGGVKSMKQLKKIQVAGTTGAVGMTDVTISDLPRHLNANLVASGSGGLDQWHPTGQSSVPH